MDGTQCSVRELFDSVSSINLYLFSLPWLPRHGTNRTSVMFVSISFIVLMMISLAWLVFYYIQRFRYLHAKDRLSVRRQLNVVDTSIDLIIIPLVDSESCATPHRRLCPKSQHGASKIPTRYVSPILLTKPRDLRSVGNATVAANDVKDSTNQRKWSSEGNCSVQSAVKIIFLFVRPQKRDFHGTGKSSSILSEKEGGLTLAIGGLHLSAREQQPSDLFSNNVKRRGDVPSPRAVAG